jgi:signal transduction histidine kinase
MSHSHDDVSREQSHRIADSAERLILIVNDLLDVARIQSGKLSLNLSQAPVSAIVANVIADMQVVASKKGTSLQVQPQGTQYEAYGDANRLQQALINIVSNAIKYTEKGNIQVVLQETRTKIVIRVQDTGMGISSEDQKELFAPFFRVAGETMSTITGTGLGMWITKQFIEMMGGSIGVESIKGVGTHVVVTLPKNPAQ